MTEIQKTDLELLIEYVNIRIKLDNQPDGYGKAISVKNVRNMSNRILMSVGRMQALLDEK